MIIECRPSSFSLWIVKWETKGRLFDVISGRNVWTLIKQERQFESYANAEGFHSGLVKRGINATLKGR